MCITNLKGKEKISLEVKNKGNKGKKGKGTTAVLGRFPLKSIGTRDLILLQSHNIRPHTSTVPCLFLFKGSSKGYNFGEKVD